MHAVVKNYLKLFGQNNLENLFSSNELGFIFNNLTNQEEKNNPNRDQWGNWEPEFTDTDYSRPVLDELVVKRMKENGLKPDSLWPDGSPFALCLSHDVDRVESYSPKVFIRNIKKRITQASGKEQIKLRLQLFYNFLKHLATSKTNDPLWKYEKWHELEKKYDFTSTYFLFIRPPAAQLSVFDCDYEPEDTMRYDGQLMSVMDYIRLLKSQGYELGIHGSYDTHDNPELLRTQKNVLEKIISEEVKVTRQHYLHYDIGKTPKVHSGLDILVDSTMGFNTAIGFRTGTSMPYFLTDKSNGMLPVLEIPMIVMDVSLYASGLFDKGLKKVKQEVVDKINLVEKVGGCLTVNFHPEYLNDQNLWEVYEMILQESRSRNAYNASMKQIHNLISERCAE